MPGSTVISLGKGDNLAIESIGDAFGASPWIVAGNYPIE